MHSFVKNDKIEGVMVGGLNGKYLLPDFDNLDFEFKDKTLKSTIKIFTDPESQDYNVLSINRFTEEAIEMFSRDDISVLDQYQLL